LTLNPNKKVAQIVESQRHGFVTRFTPKPAYAKFGVRANFFLLLFLLLHFFEARAGIEPAHKGLLPA
jgi:hypothetical protein